MAHSTSHTDRVFGLGNGGIHQHRVAADFHGQHGIRGRSHPGIDQDRNFGLLNDQAKIEEVLDAATRADGGRSWHYRGRPGVFQLLGIDRIVGAIDHHLKPFSDQQLQGAQGLFHIR